MQIRPNVLSDLIWVQTVYKAHSTRTQRVKHVNAAVGGAICLPFVLYVSLVYANNDCAPQSSLFAYAINTSAITSCYISCYFERYKRTRPSSKFSLYLIFSLLKLDITSFENSIDKECLTYEEAN